MSSPDVGQISSRRVSGKIRVIETWFDEEPFSTKGYDLLVCHQRSRPLSARRWLYFYSIHIDLSLSGEQLLERMNNTTSKEIKRAKEKDEIECCFLTSPTWSDVENFASMYDQHPRTDSQDKIDRKRLHQYNSAGLLHLSKARAKDGTDLLWRLLLVHKSQRRVQPLFIASPRYSTSDKELAHLVGRANRLLHYGEMLHYKENGCLIYDFNGWYAGVEDKKRLQINQFKEGFGGKIVCGFDCEEPLSLRGHVYLLLQAFRRLFQPQQRREFRRRRRKAPRLEPGFDQGSRPAPAKATALEPVQRTPSSAERI